MGRSPLVWLRRARRAAQAAEDVGLAHPDVDQHRDDQDAAPMKTLTQCCGMTKKPST